MKNIKYLKPIKISPKAWQNQNKMELVLSYQFPDHLALTLVTVKEWELLQQKLQTLNDDDILTLSTINMKVKDYKANIKVKNDINFINSFKLVANNNKWLGTNLLVEDEEDDEQIWREIERANADIPKHIKDLVRINK